jgi:hypothetical protein
MAHGGLADHGAAVGVPDEHDRPVNALQEAAHVCRVARQPAQGVGRGHDRIAVVLQVLDHAVPAGGVHEGTVYQHDRGLLLRRAVLGPDGVGRSRGDHRDRCDTGECAQRDSALAGGPESGLETHGVTLFDVREVRRER